VKNRIKIAISTLFLIASVFLSVGYSSLFISEERPFPLPGPTIPAIPAFPGAEGFGAKTRGAYALPNQRPVVLKVTNLNDSGNGSLRWALEYDGPRVVVFNTGGTIKLNQEISVEHPYLTIAGQTAPGGGICIKGAPIRIKSHNIIVRGLRVRNGNLRTSTDFQNGDGLSIEASGGYTCPNGEPNNIIIDHCSITWGSDENGQVWYAAHDITWQWNIIAESIWSPAYPEITGYGLLIGSRVHNISIHHNLFAHNKARNPECNADTKGEIVNNVVYNWSNKGTDFIGSPKESPNSGFYDFQPSYWNLVGNYYKKKGTEGNPKPLLLFNYPGWNKEYYIHENSKFYLEGNANVANSSRDWDIVSFEGGGNGSSYKSESPVIGLSGIKAGPADSIYSPVLNNVGARLPIVDSVDARIIADVQNGTGEIRSSVSDGDYPVLESGSAPVDSDDDGLPDSFELSQGGSVIGIDPNENAPSGYSWIEEYVNSLIPAVN